jgi:hypothetical protein
LDYLFPLCLQALLVLLANSILEPAHLKNPGYTSFFVGIIYERKTMYDHSFACNASAFVRAVADVPGKVFNSPPGNTWVRASTWFNRRGQQHTRTAHAANLIAKSGVSPYIKITSYCS